MTAVSGKRALIVIDVQNDYFPDGKFPLHNAEATLDAVLTAAAAARAQGVPVVFVRHVADETRGPAPFFSPGSRGAALHPRLAAVVADAPQIVKTHADAFFRTDLEETLAAHEVEELLLCGMMTQNCVTHTALSKAAEKYRTVILSDCCCTVSEILHRIALNAVAPRLTVAPAAALLSLNAP
jgi:nicotinamidase-related amidase